jgi:hypothetical protein
MNYLRFYSEFFFEGLCMKLFSLKRGNSILGQ